MIFKTRAAVLLFTLNVRWPQVFLPRVCVSTYILCTAHSCHIQAYKVRLLRENRACFKFPICFLLGLPVSFCKQCLVSTVCRCLTCRRQQIPRRL